MKKILFPDKAGDKKRIDALKALVKKIPGLKPELASRMGYNSTGVISAWFATGNIPHYRRQEVDAFLTSKGA